MSQEGRGLANYSTDRPSYGFSTATTQFDDALMKRGIVTFEQAMIAKGATPHEARRLAHLKFRTGCERGNDVGAAGKIDGVAERRDGGADEDENDVGGPDQDDDEDFLERYREKRFRELKHQSFRRPPTGYGDVLPISRSDWTREVNDASSGGRWVVVHLTPGSLPLRSPLHLDTCRVVEEAVGSLARRFHEVKFVSIPAASANESWPAERLPTLFCYRDGRLRDQMVGVEEFGGWGVTEGRVEWRLAGRGVLESELDSDPEPHRATVKCSSDAEQGGKGGSRFQGGMAQWATGRGCDESASDYDDVD
uniref:Phosducin domain-containing protein n=1 Tax=Odontella aurita TaxID=265563 RepID=A0A7S4JX89_9STRA|mmetsp:Transcript_55531/g.166481  ORF Transcript_55531/g.166481 Transcript_55531/m.166481 type:complete len:308 (+) Transcript_55531:80-1003(+)